jgi:flagellum-specific ATP synthase
MVYEDQSEAGFLAALAAVPSYRLYGRVTAVLGLGVEIAGIENHLSVGSRLWIIARDNRRILCEVVGFRQGRAITLPFGALDGVGLGCRAEMADSRPEIRPSMGWLGRVMNALGDPLDNQGALPQGVDPIPVRNTPPPAHTRQRVGGKIDLGVRALNTFLTCCRGQRMGIFAGSGVGKSVLMGMLARYSSADVIVIGLIGERGREVQEFIHDDLGPDGLARSVLVVATSDEAPLMRRQAAYMTLAVAEYFRGQGKDVLCLMDSVTRFAMAQREIGLSAGEPPTTKGYPPTTFAELPKILERAGPGPQGAGAGSITGIFTVLVEGDDHNEPVADAVRGILDGHIVMERGIAERGRYPAINILRSVSRTMPGCNSDAENTIVTRARRLMAAYDNMEEMIRLGAYRKGSDPLVDEAIFYHDQLDSFLRQAKDERSDLQSGYDTLSALLDKAG